MKIAIYPGSFDPVTNGHLNIIRRAACIFDKLIVCVMVNAGKEPMFTTAERVQMLSAVTKDMDNVVVDSSEELLAEYARRQGGCVIVKGLRAATDFEKEFQMATCHVKPRKQGEEGGIIRKEIPIRADKVMLICPKCGKPTRVGHKLLENGDKVRACKKCGEIM